MKTLHRILILTLISMGAYAGIIHVPADQPTIQAGIDAAANGDTVLVADSTYLENINYKGKAITVASHYIMDGDTAHISATVIDGSQPADPDSGSVVTFESGEDTTSVLYGLTIRGGSGTVTEYTYYGAVYPERAGGGILCYESGARISNNIIINNIVPVFTESGGGGVSVLAGNSAAYARIDSNKIISNIVNGGRSWGSGIELNGNGMIFNNFISFNTTNATTDAFGALNSWSDARPLTVMIKDNQITRNEVNGNDALAGGLLIASGVSASIIGNDVSYNVLTGTHGCNCGGIYVWNSIGAILIDRNTVTHNMLNNNTISWGGGISLWADNPTTNRDILITNNIISGNQAREGAGMFSRRGDAQIINNTIVDNTATIRGGGILLRGSSGQATVLNTILRGNSPGNSQISPEQGAIATVRYSDVQGGWPGAGNIDLDPQFVPGDSLFHLTNASPCVNTGADSLQINGQWYFSPPNDYDGQERPYQGHGADMGADETQVPLAIEPQPVAGIPASYALHQNYPNPFNPSTTIEFALAKSGWVTLRIFNILGEEVAELVSENLSAGSYRYNWDARKLVSGVYFYRLEAGRFSQTKKLLLLK